MGTGSQPNLYRLQAQTTTYARAAHTRYSSRTGEGRRGTHTRTNHGHCSRPHSLDVTPPTSTRRTHSPLRSTPRRHATTRLDGEPARKPEHKEVVTPRQQASSAARSTRHASARRAYETAQDTDTDTARRHVDDTARRIKIRALASSTPTRAAQPRPRSSATPPSTNRIPHAPSSTASSVLPSRGAMLGRVRQHRARKHGYTTTRFPSARACMYPETHAAAAEPTHAGTCALDSRRKTRRASDSVYLQAHTLAPYARSQDTHAPRTPSAGSTARMHKPPTGTHAYGWESPPTPAIPAGRCRRPTREEEDACVGDGALVQKREACAAPTGSKRRGVTARSLSASPHLSLSLRLHYRSAAEEKRERGDGAYLEGHAGGVCIPKSGLGTRDTDGQWKKARGEQTEAWQDIGAPRRKVRRRAGLVAEGESAEPAQHGTAATGSQEPRRAVPGARFSERAHSYKPTTGVPVGAVKNARGAGRSVEGGERARRRSMHVSSSARPRGRRRTWQGVTPLQVRAAGDGAYAAPSRNPRCWRARDGAHSEWSVRGRRRATNFLRAEDEEVRPTPNIACPARVKAYWRTGMRDGAALPRTAAAPDPQRKRRAVPSRGLHAGGLVMLVRGCFSRAQAHSLSKGGPQKQTKTARQRKKG
ncbi:hypothetical protein C8J57DRAFT_1711680 [Mycena rebaudengoi]|nr:hypothetical protein C8J57DRAFT_1711680 [Mycena rebaudengoi]